MRRRQVAITLVSVIVLGMSCALYFGWHSEPSSHGYRLSQLLATYIRIYEGHLTTPGWQDTRQYVREIGPNSLPQLLRWLGEEQPQWKTNLFAFHGKMPPIFRTKFVHSWLSGEREEFHVKAAKYGFEILGPIAAPVVPQLMQMGLDSNHPGRAQQAVDALAAIGRDAVPALLRIATSTNAMEQWRAVRVLGSMGTNAAAAVPTLVGLARSKNVVAAEQAIRALGELQLSPETVVPAIAEYVEHPSLHPLALSTLTDFGAAARPAIPRLVQCLTNLDPNLRQNAAWALAGLKLEPEIAVPVLMARLGTDTNAAVRIGLSAALHAYMWPDSAVNPPRFGRYAHVWYPENDNAGNEQLLKKIELRWYAQQLAAKPHGKGIQPVMSIAYLTTSLTDSDAAIRRQSADALARCPTNARPAVPALVVCLKDTDREVVAAAIEALGNLHLEPDLVVPALTECLKVPEARSRAIFALSQFGKDAQSAVPSLREFLNSDFEDPAKYALEKIAPEPSKRADPPRRAIGLPVRPIREQDYRFP